MSLCLSFSFTVLFGTPICIPPYCASLCLGCAATLQFHYGCFFSVLYSGHRILSPSSFDIPATTSLYLYQVHFTLTAPLSFAKFSLYLYASRHWLYQIFFNCSPETKPYPWFSCILVPLYLYPPHSTNVTTSHLVFHPYSSRAAPLGGIPFLPQYPCAFLHKECTGLFSCCAFCGLTAHAVFLLLLFSFSTLIFGYFHL